MKESKRRLTKICSLLLATVLLIGLPTAGYAQAAQAAKSASKAVTRIFSKKVAKEAAEESAEKGAKLAAKKGAKESAELTGKKLGEKIAKETISNNVQKSVAKAPVDKYITKDLAEYRKLGSYKVIQSRFEKAAAYRVAKEVGSESAGLAGKKATYEAGKSFAEKLGTKESAVAFEKGMAGELKYAGKRLLSKGVIKESGENSLKLVADVPGIEKMLKGMRENYGPLFELDNLNIATKEGRRIVSFKGTNSVMEIDGDVIRANGGSFTRKLSNGEIDAVGSINQFLNNPLPNRTYLAENGLITYRTNFLGKVEYIEAKSSALYKRMQTSGMTRNPSFDKNMVNKVMNEYGVSNSTHDFGHLVRRELGGLNESINGLPMLKDMQRSGSKWYKLEQMEVDACKAGKDVVSRMHIKYADNGGYVIEVEKIIDGKSKGKVPFEKLFSKEKTIASAPIKKSVTGSAAITLTDKELIETIAGKVGLDAKSSEILLEEMRGNKALTALIHENPEFNIARWLNTRRPVDKSLVSKYARNTSYAGKNFYFHPALNKNIESTLAEKGVFSGYTREELLALDRLFPNGVPYTKAGHPDFVGAGVCKLDDMGSVIKIEMPGGHFTGNRDKDFAIAREIARSKYGKTIEEYGYIWHHLEGDPASMVLVRTECHEICRHTGGHALEKMRLEGLL